MARRHKNHRHIFLYIKLISFLSFLWMDVMLDFICIGFAEL